ncbi:MAG: MSEP-CTERM sorting domain-containing protein [Verrucomicrobia bacterium]|nr:MSEP-CTERM sorting domain-containing protein [Verrucomicrobiota bacterium]MBU4291102.1 MSEP-CTERM sorting domain-containing protein [Verrucomicrobiota bacterium]MBU4429905.1 MSEP-CTERM sorting domain-containing protein [Verrucomicrobiota bacterium]MBU4498139.1 MSEP-CTERM sorting domain-containing protein [Verrucomicrobiota bacterium]MCG2680119.1 MSEP-CTERM sorting domain-containing protein [Kiritimatiellia bacterium]
MNATADRSQLFGDILRKPAFILWTMILPQLLLLAINISSWNLVSGEMSAIQKGNAFMIGAFEVALLGAGAIAFTGLQILKKGVGRILSVGIILAHIGYLWTFTSAMRQLVPTSVADWILPGGELLYYQYALIMPALFYAGFRLVSFEIPLRQIADFGVSLGVLLLLPIAWFVVFSLARFLPWGFEPPVIIGIVFFVASTVIALLAFLRVLLIVYAWVNRVVHGRLVLLVVTGIAAPIGGLLLNIAYPFPYDFQDPWVYILTILNGLILLIPTPKTTSLRVGIWYLRALVFPFSLYFFVVFLPFLPLSLLAMLACGAGCLILAPTLLFVIHTRCLLDEGRALIPQKGWTVVLALLVAGVLTIPAGYTVRALYDRQALMSAVDAVYSRDADVTRVSFNPHSALRAVERLRNQKNGIQVPFISDYYNWLVFNGLVLPDYKMDAIELVLSGAKPAKPKINSHFSFAEIFATRGRSRPAWRSTPAPPRRVELTTVNTNTERAGDVLKTRVQLQMRNGTDNAAEFVTDITVPPGVMVTGYWLNMETNRVPGRIFEKKTAMWVYHMIRDTTRRDPGLLVYQDEHRLKLSVFPFRQNEERITEIEFTFPAIMDPEIVIGTRPLRLNSDAQLRAEPIRFKHAGSDALAVPRAVLNTFPTVRRKPYLHFILDCSATAEKEAHQFAERIRREAARFPEAGGCLISAANYEVTDLTDQFIPLADAAELVTASRGKMLPFRGALCPEYAIKRGLPDFRFGLAFDKSGELMVPIFVVIKADATTPVMPTDLAVFADAVPDVPAWYITRLDGRLDACAFDGRTNTIVERPSLPEPAVVFRHGDAIVTHCAKTDAIISFRPTAAPIMYFDPATRQFIEITNIIKSAHDSGYGAAISLWLDWRDTVIRPSTLNARLPAIVKASRESNVIVPLTSYIVVENSAQWKMLVIKEKQSLAADHALAFDEFKESPEPASWLLLPIACALLWWRRTRQYG